MSIDKIEYKGYTIITERDDYTPENPLEEFADGVISNVYSQYGLHAYDTSGYPYNAYKGILSVPEYDKEYIRKNWKEIINEIVPHNGTLLSFIREWVWCEPTDALEAFADAITQAFDSLSTSDKMATVEALYNMLPDFAAYHESAHGYSQSDWHEVVLVAKLDEVKMSKEAATKMLEATANIYRQWAYGDIYCFSVIDKEGDHVESIGGAYCDFEDEHYNELVSEMKAIIDAEVENEAIEAIDKDTAATLLSTIKTQTAELIENVEQLEKRLNS